MSMSLTTCRRASVRSSRCPPHWWLISATVALLLMACTPSGPPPKPLADLHQPGVSQIPGIISLHAPPMRGTIETLTTYMSAGVAAAPRVLFTLDDQLYTVGLDGSDLRSLGIQCSGQVSATPNGRWAACQRDADIVLTSLTAATPDNGRVIISDVRGNTTWLLDGRHLAVVSRSGGLCAIEIYLASPAFDQVQLSARLMFLQLSDSAGDCTIFGLAWSPDDSWLAFVAAGGPSHVYAMSMASLLPEILHSHSLFTFDVPSSMLLDLGRTGVFTPPSWSDEGTELALTFTGPDLRHITQVELTSRRSSSILSVPEGRIDAIAWTLDSKHLIFANGQFPCLECSYSFTPSHLYVYTPLT